MTSLKRYPCLLGLFVDFSLDLPRLVSGQRSLTRYSSKSALGDADGLPEEDMFWDNARIDDERLNSETHMNCARDVCFPKATATGTAETADAPHLFLLSEQRRSLILSHLSSLTHTTAARPKLRAHIQS